MTNLPATNLHDKIKRFSLLLAFIWTCLIGAIVVAGAWVEKQDIISQATELGRNRFTHEQDVLQWVAHYNNNLGTQLLFPRLTEGQAKHVPVLSGDVRPLPIKKEYTTDFIRQYMHNHPIHHDLFLVNFDTSTLDKPGNEWLLKAYEAFNNNSNVNEYSEITILDGEDHLMMGQPLIAEKTCLKCHAEKGFQEGDILGGIGQAISLGPMYVRHKRHMLRWIIGFFVVWLFGLTGIVLARNNSLSRLSEFNKISKNLIEEEKIRASENVLFKSIFNSISDIIVIADKDRNVIEVNDAFEQLSGYTREEVIGKQTQFFYSDQQSHLHAGKLIYTSLNSTPSTPFEIECKKKDGSVVPCELFPSRVIDENNTPRGNVIIVRDISVRKLAEHEEGMKKSSLRIILRLRELRDFPPERVFLYGLEECTKLLESEFGIVFFYENEVSDTKILFWTATDIESNEFSNSVKNNFGEDGDMANSLRSSTAAIHNDFHKEILQPESFEGKSQIERYLNIPLSDNGNITSTFIFANKKIPYSTFELQVAESIVKEMNKIILWQQEQAEKEQLDIQLQEVQKMEAVGLLAGGITHDFNNILSIISCNADMLLDDMTNKKGVEAHIFNIIEATSSAKELIDQLLAFTRKSNQDIFPLNPAILLKECLSLLRSIVPSSIEITQNISHDAGTIMANPTQFQQIIINLFYNAIDALTGETGMIRVIGEGIVLEASEESYCERISPGKYFQISICDTGAGIDISKWEKIFDPFFTTKDIGKGTGLGLTIAKGIVQNLGGMIQLESEPGRGTSFHIFFPIISNKDIELDAPDEKVITPGNNERILVVDDEIRIAEVTAKILSQHGYHVTIRLNGEDAFSLFQSEPKNFDLIITDQVMPSMTGTKLAASILAIRPDLPIILNTGYMRNLSEEHIYKTGIRAILNKPYNKSKLLKLVGKTLEADLERIHVPEDYITVT